MFRRTGLLLAVLALSACQVDDTTRPRLLDVQAPSAGISDGSSGGNPEFFFYPPLAANPAANPNFDAGASNAGLQPYAVICELADPSSATNCQAVATPPGNAGGIRLTYSAAGEFYQEGWKTSQSGLSSNKLYRIEVFAVPVLNRLAVDANFIATYRYGYRDIDPDDGPNTGACSGEEFCKVNNGSNVAIKVRIERFASCPETRACASGFVPSNVTTNLQQPSGNQITIPGQSTNFFLNFDVCTAAEEAAVDAAIDLPTFGPCFKTETPFTGMLTDPAILAICEEINFVDPNKYSHSQKDQITLHHFDTDGGSTIKKVEALPEANNCPQVASAATGRGPLGMLARAVRNSINSLIHPRQLYATALDVGGGGLADDLSSLFKLALPGKFEYLNAADAVRVALVGSAVTLNAKVTDLQNNPILGARVTWNLVSSPGSGGSLVGTPPIVGTTDATGIAQVVLNVSQTPGENIVHASGKGIADARETGCSLPPATATTASCNGPLRTTFDPFIPLNLHLDGTLGLKQKVQLAAGTRLAFTVIGCERGRGTPTVNGVLGAGEWDCAQSVQFPVSLSGGSATATMYWMNDATNMYIAISVPGTGRENSLRIDWDNDGDVAGLAQGSRELGDDIWEFTPGTGNGTTTDRYVDSKCLTSSQAGCGADDGAGKNQTFARFRNDLGGVTVYELSHPLNTGDKNGTLPIDIAAAAGQKLGNFVTLRLGSGAQGNSQWPGFLKYQEIIIR